MKNQFRVLPAHINLLKNTNVKWEDDLHGAPRICAEQPYGTPDVINDIASILEISPASFKDRSFTEDQKQRMKKLHQETAIALQIFLHNLTMQPGLYEQDTRGRWRKASIMI